MSQWRGCGLRQWKGGAREADGAGESDCADEVSFIFSEAGDRGRERSVEWGSS